MLKESRLEAPLLERAYLFLLFHKLFGGRPNNQLLEILLSPATHRIVEESTGNNPTMQGFSRFLQALAAEDHEALLARIRSEYERFFVGPMALPAYPYESPYRTSEATLFQQNTSDVREIYRAYGLLPVGYLQVPDDHVAVMCAFMARLATTALGILREGNPDALENLLSQQASFSREHLANWIPDYAIQARTVHTPILYPQVIEAFAAFVPLDLAFLEDCLAQLHAGSALTDAHSNQPESALQSAFAILNQVRLDGLEAYGLERVSN